MVSLCWLLARYIQNGLKNEAILFCGLQLVTGWHQI